MSELGNAVTLLDLAKAGQLDEMTSRVVNIMTKVNPILEDMAWVEGNLPTGNKASVLSGLPDVTWRKLNYGVQPSKATFTEITDTCGMIDGYSEIDVKVANLAKDVNEYRMQQSRAHFEAMAQTLASAIFYADQTVDKEKITGLAPRYSSLSAENGGQIISAGGSGSDNTSIWVVGWGDQQVHGIFPRNSKAGWSMKDLGEQTSENFGGTGLKAQVYRANFSWDCGLTLLDWRYVSRLANIDMSDMATISDASSSAPNLLKLLQLAVDQIWNIGSCRPVIYCSRRMLSYFKIALMNKSNVWLSMEDYMGTGKKQLMFDGIPIKRCDAIVNTESAVS